MTVMFWGGGGLVAPEHRCLVPVVDLPVSALLLISNGAGSCT